jgi:hypothetical protein
MEVYLHSDHDGLTEDQFVTLLRHHNKHHPAMPNDFKLVDLKPQLDKQGHQQGRIARLQAGTSFYTYCKNRNFELKFSGGSIPCITKEDKTRNLHQMKRTNYQNNNTNTGNKDPGADKGQDRNAGNNTKKPKGG